MTAANVVSADGLGSSGGEGVVCKRGGRSRVQVLPAVPQVSLGMMRSGS